VIYEWDPRKANSNLRTHGVPFEEAASVFLDPFAITYPDQIIQGMKSERLRLAIRRNGE